MMEILQDSVALVTGGSTGIGKAIVRELAHAGATVIINYHTHTEEALSLKNELRARGLRVEAIQANITHRDDIQEMIATVLKLYGKIDILVNNAGITKDRSIQKMTFEEWEDVIGVNLTGAFSVTKEVVPHMISKKTGRIVNIASVIGSTGAFGQANYAASKAGLIGFTKSCALELAKHGISVNALCPGYINTEMLAKVPAEQQKKLIEKIPLGRVGTPEEIARTVKFLVSDASYMTGQCLHVNGGLFLA